MASQEERDRLSCMAKLADEAKRYHDMVDSMKKLAYLDVELTREERTLLSAAYKSLIGPMRHSWRILVSIEQEARKRRRSERRVKVIREFRQKLESDISNVCNDVLAVVDEHLVPFSSSSDVESSVVYLNLKGDYLRYLAEIKIGDERKEVAEQALTFYQAASSIAEKEMGPDDPIRLGLVLNLSVFYYEFLNSPQWAKHTAKRAF